MSAEVRILEFTPVAKNSLLGFAKVQLPSGLIVQVPAFINQGERIRISTSEGTYQERA